MNALDLHKEMQSIHEYNEYMGEMSREKKNRIGGNYLLRR